jgi:hypothetical protein
MAPSLLLVIWSLLALPGIGLLVLLAANLF